MNRKEACELLTRIAQDELIDMQVSKDFLKARDIVICKPNKILDVLASEETRETYKNQLIVDLRELLHNRLIAINLRMAIRELISVINENKLSGKCTEMFIETRCKNCPNYVGKKND